MLNYIWAGMIVISFIAAIINGRLDAAAKAVFDGASDAVTMCISLLGMLALWSGIMKIGEKSGLISVFAHLLRPLTKLIFPKLKKDCAAMNAIVMNMVANMLGMSNAATPLGVTAMKELSKLNCNSPTASNDMAMFVIVNTASIQLIPSTVIALRYAAGSADPSGLIVPVWIASVVSIAVGIISARFMQQRR